MLFCPAIAALHPRLCPDVAVLGSRIKFRPADSIQIGLQGTGHHLMFFIHTSVGPQPGGLEVCSLEIKWERQQKAGMLQDLVLGEISHLEQELSSHFVNIESRRHVITPYPQGILLQDKIHHGFAT